MVAHKCEKNQKLTRDKLGTMHPWVMVIQVCSNEGMYNKEIFELH